MLTKAAVARKEAQPRSSPPLTLLPQPLLELILIKGTSKQDKKVLRQTCKLFRQVVDDGLTCILLKISQWQKAVDRECLENLLKRIEHVRGLETVVLDVHGKDPYNLGNLLQHLSVHVRTVVNLGNCINLKELTRLPCLTTLDVREFGNRIKGLEHISGLTRLHCDRHVGSLSHLAPTLKALQIYKFTHVKDMYKLTNLEHLNLSDDLPSDFFQTHDQLPLKQLVITPSRCREFFTVEAWESAPTSLTRLTLDYKYKSLPSVLPASITHLQLLLRQSSVEKAVKDAAVVLPGLRSLDVSLYGAQTNQASKVFRHLSKFTNLQPLGVCIRQDYVKSEPWRREKVLATLLDIATAVGKGVSLNVVEDYDQFLGYFQEIYAYESVWATSG